jgi:hypothetical protein
LFYLLYELPVLLFYCHNQPKPLKPSLFHHKASFLYFYRDIFLSLSLLRLEAAEPGLIHIDPYKQGPDQSTPPPFYQNFNSSDMKRIFLLAVTATLLTGAFAFAGGSKSLN